MLGPVVPPSGPTPCRIALVGEFPGDEESANRQPLLGASGKELRRMFDQLGVALDDVYYTAVFNRQPPGGELAAFCTTTPSPESRALGPLTTDPMGWIADEHLGSLERLRAELEAVAPNVVVTLGNVAAWALIGRQGIASIRGAVHVSHLAARPLKVLPTYHPAAILRQYSLRTIALCDLEKALAEATTPDLRYDYAEIWTEPTLDDLAEFGVRYLDSAPVISTDVETRRGQITCVGLAPGRGRGIVVPFWTGTEPRNYWPTVDAEIQARRWVGNYLENPRVVKVLQNGLYDVQYFIAEGYQPRNCTEDTMLAHHSLWSELPKSLEYLGSTFTNFRSWKGIHKIRADEKLKRDD